MGNHFSRTNACLDEISKKYRDADWYFKNGWKDDEGRKIPVPVQRLIVRASDRQARLRGGSDVQNR